MIIFQLNFYTDTFGITAAAAGTLLLVARVWDAVFETGMTPQKVRAIKRQIAARYAKHYG